MKPRCTASMSPAYAHIRPGVEKIRPPVPLPARPQGVRRVRRSTRRCGSTAAIVYVPE
jgi:hypothetical protein